MTEKPIDVDMTWDGKGSLDEHRQREFAKIEQPGFGSKSVKAKARETAQQPDEQPAANGVDADGE